MRTNEVLSLLCYGLFVVVLSFLPSIEIASSILYRNVWETRPSVTLDNIRHASPGYTLSNDASPSSSTPTNPWSFPPVCTDHVSDLDSELCVYTLASFNNGTGLSLFTTPDHAQLFLSLPVFDSHKPLSVPNASYHLSKRPGKGVSLIASESLSQLTPILTTQPVLIMHPSPSLTTEIREHFLTIALKQLNPSTQASFHNLSKMYHLPSVAAQDVVRSNAFELPLAHPSPPCQHMHLAVFPEASRINHDCAPNAMYYIDADTLTHHVSATRDITAGEEVTVAYLNVLQGREARGWMGQQGWGFECHCPRCERERKKGDDIEQITIMEQKLKKIARGLWRKYQEAKQQQMKHIGEEMDQDIPSPVEIDRLIEDYRDFFRSHGLEGFMEQAYRLFAVIKFLSSEEISAVSNAKDAAQLMQMRYGPKHADVTTWRDLGREIKFDRWRWEYMLTKYFGSSMG
jgi:hypothetical protein